MKSQRVRTFMLIWAASACGFDIAAHLWWLVALNAIEVAYWWYRIDAVESYQRFGPRRFR